MTRRTGSPSKNPRHTALSATFVNSLDTARVISRVIPFGGAIGRFRFSFLEDFDMLVSQLKCPPRLCFPVPSAKPGIRERRWAFGFA
jgi:hypothetical protein